MSWILLTILLFSGGIFIMFLLMSCLGISKQADEKFDHCVMSR